LAALESGFRRVIWHHLLELMYRCMDKSWEASGGENDTDVLRQGNAKELTSPITLDKMISLKYWLEDPFSTRMPSRGLSFNFSELGDGGMLLLPSGTWMAEADASSLAWARDFSKLEIRDAISAMMVLFARRLRGPAGGKLQALPARVQAEHGSFLSQRIFLLLQAWQERTAHSLGFELVMGAVGGVGEVVDGSSAGWEQLRPTALLADSDPAVVSELAGRGGDMPDWHFRI
jgi:hypothetical protein